MKWFIEDIWEGETQSFINAIKDICPNDEVSIVDISSHEYQEFFDKNSEIFSILFGSIQMCTYMQKYRIKHRIYPGPIYSSKEDYSCLSYYKAYGEHLLNSDYIVIPYYDLQRKADDIFHYCGIDSAIFIRPNNPNKIWTGEVVYKENFQNWVDRQIGFGKFNDSELAFISKPINIIEEYRCVIGKEGYITGSLYRRGITHLTSAEVPDLVIKKCNEMSHLYSPDAIFVMDIALVDGGEPSLLPYIIEIGPISCAGLYDCDKRKVVKYIKENF